MISVLFNELFYRPIFNLLIVLYEALPWRDFGIAILLLTAASRMLVYPLTKRAARSQRIMAHLQPRIKELQEQYKGDPQGQGRAMMAFYKEHKFNPLSGCVPILVQLPMLFALFAVFQSGLKIEAQRDLYSFVPHPGAIAPIAFSFLPAIALDLTKNTPLILAVLAGAAQFLQARMMLRLNPQMSVSQGAFDMNKALAVQTQYFFPILTVYLAVNFPAGLGLYWVATTIIAIGQQYFINRSLAKEKLIT